MKKILFYMGLGLARLFVLLPYSVQLKCASTLGLIAMHFMKRRVHIADVNLKLCFPEYSDVERTKIRKKSFQSLGMGAAEALMAWFMSGHRFNQIPFKVIGMENYQEALAENRGVLVVSAHFDCMEMIPRFLRESTPASVVYKKSHHVLFNELIIKSRQSYIFELISHQNLKAMVRVLKNKGTLWYAPDQDFGAVRSVFAPFFHEKVASVLGAMLLCQISGAVAIPFFFHRLPNNQGYEAVFLPRLQNFPSGNDLNDAARVNALLEAEIRKYPEQYLWIHRRFKTRPPGEKSFYGDKK